MNAREALRELAALLGGHVNSNRVLAPGPGHSLADRSLSVTPAKNDDGFVVHSFAGDDRQACIEHVRSLLDPEKRVALAGLGADLPVRNNADDKQRAERGREIWSESVSPLRTPAEVYLWRYRHLDLEPGVAGDVIRYHPECLWKDELTKRIFRAHCMVAALRDIRSNEIVGVHCTRLSLVGEKLGRRFRGIFAGTAIKLDDDDAVTHGLAIAEGVETAMTARQLGLRPTWALASAGAIASFPLLSGIESLTILAERDHASAKAVQACAQRWHGAKREVLVNRPLCGKDLNDALRGVA